MNGDKPIASDPEGVEAAQLATEAAIALFEVMMRSLLRGDSEMSDEAESKLRSLGISVSFHVDDPEFL